MKKKSIHVAVVGASGYTGIELVRLLLAHPAVELSAVFSRTSAGRRWAELFPQFAGKTELVLHESLTDKHSFDLVFFATPPTVAMQAVPRLLDKKIKVIDLSPDFRIRDSQLWSRHYATEHSCPQLLSEAVYGLSELNRYAIARAQLIANPGCYATAVLLAAKPLMQEASIDCSWLIADACSGVSGAGRQARLSLSLGELANNFMAYKADAHRHTPEIKQQLDEWNDQRPLQFAFTPHLLPIPRGIHATLYCRSQLQEEGIRALFQAAYQHERFIQLLPAGAYPQTGVVSGSNECHLAVYRQQDNATVKILVALDNLIKGAAGQAVQNMNLMFNIDEHCGLDSIACFP